eukprot:11178308-Lingulodinium_polyedra.AAC.1
MVLSGTAPQRQAGTVGAEEMNGAKKEVAEHLRTTVPRSRPRRRRSSPPFRTRRRPSPREVE